MCQLPRKGGQVIAGVVEASGWIVVYRLLGQSVLAWVEGLMVSASLAVGISWDGVFRLNMHRWIFSHCYSDGFSAWRLVESVLAPGLLLQGELARDHGTGAGF